MPYAQTNYPTVPQGIPPTRYTVAQIGCFITSFCNLMERFGRPMPPSTLNSILRDSKLYIDVDDGVRDDVSWDTILKVDGNIGLSATGYGGPPNDNCIVKFVYDGGKTHFCLVQSAAQGTIIDSWDGKVKSWNTYGGVKAWASYTNKVQGGTPNMAGVPDTDAWFSRFRQTMQQMRGRDMTREEFRKNIVPARDPFDAVTAISDSPEAYQFTADGHLGQRARAENWEQKINSGAGGSFEPITEPVYRKKP